MQGAPRVLLAEDDEDFKVLLSPLLRSEGYLVTEAKDGDAFLDLLIEASQCEDGRLSYDAIITDVVMPGFSGLDVLQAFRRSTGSAALIVMSAFEDAQVERSARALSAAFLRKPFEIDRLLQILTGALAPVELARRRRSKTTPFS